MGKPLPTLLWFLKAPHAGEVKTRLATDLGAEEAARVYQLLVKFSWQKLSRSGKHEVHFSPASAEEEMRTWLGPEADYFSQDSGNLGARLQAAVHRYYQRRRGKIFLLGGDCPYLTPTYLQAAIHALDHVDVVMGPAHDGGYVLLGISREHPELFRDIPWSGPEVCAITSARAREQGASIKLLDPLEDVDDLSSWQRAQRAFSFPGPRR